MEFYPVQVLDGGAFRSFGEAVDLAREDAPAHVADLEREHGGRWALVAAGPVRDVVYAPPPIAEEPAETVTADQES